MRFQIILLVVFTSQLFLAGCGGDNTHPYDGTWEAVYPIDVSSSITDTKTVLCSSPPAALIIRDSSGTTTQNTTCTTTILATPLLPATSYTQITYYNISVSIESNATTGRKDVLNAIVNGSKLTGNCISTIACEASAAGNTLSLTR